MLIVPVGAILLQTDDLIQFFVVNQKDLFVGETVIFFTDVGVLEPCGNAVTDHILVVKLMVLVKELV